MLAMDLSLSWNLDVMVRVCERLEVDDVLQCARVCSKWREFVETERMWRTLWDRDMVYFASASKSFGSHTFASYREAYVYFYAFAGTPVFEIQASLEQIFIPDMRYVKNGVSEKWDCGYNHKTHEVGLAFRGETERLRSLLERTELGIDVNKLQCYKHWYYYGNFSHGMDGLIYRSDSSDSVAEVLDSLVLDNDEFFGDKESLEYAIETSRSLYALDPLTHVQGEAKHERLQKIDPQALSRAFCVLKQDRCRPEVQERIWDLCNNYCGTLLHWAVLGNHLDTVKLLREFGADVTIVVPKLNAKAIDIAKGNGYVEIYHYLKSCEQKPVAEKVVVK